MFLSGWFKKRPQPPPDTERLRVLLLSMSLEDRFLMERLGKQQGWALWSLESPKEGFRLASKSGFDVILCDRNQPGYPWREVLDRFSADAPRSCVVLISPLNDDYLWGEVIQHGGYDVVTRPLREESVLHVIQAAVRFLAAPTGVPSTR